MSAPIRETFATHQENTKVLRQKIAHALRLPPGHEDFIQVFLKKNESEASTEHTGFEALTGIYGLSLVHHVDPGDGRSVPTTVVNAARGTVLYDLKGIVVKPIATPDNLYMNKLAVQNGFVTLKGLVGDVRLAADTVLYRTYYQGTMMRLVKMNGVKTWFTSKNIIPSGAWQNGHRLHKVSKRGPAKPFVQSVEEIAACADPSLNDDANNDWFPKETLFSRWEYRFILCTRENSTYQTDYIPKDGYLLYLGAVENWDRTLPSGMTPKLLGARHEKAYEPNYSTVPTTEDKDDSYIIKASYITLAEANKVLAGNADVDPRLSGGGKLIVTGENSSGHPLTYHIVSPGWAHRERTLGNNPTLYAGFQDCLDKQDYDLSKPADREAFLELFPLLCVPGNEPGDCRTLAEIQEIVKSYGQLPIVMLPSDTADEQIYSRDIRMIWYNFLLCANISVRLMVFRFLVRYEWDLMKAAEHIMSLEGKVAGDQDLLDALWDARKSMLKKSVTMNLKSIIEYLKGNRRFARKVVHAIMENKKLKQASILISEPDAVFFVPPDAPGTYASAVTCKNPGRR